VSRRLPLPLTDAARADRRRRLERLRAGIASGSYRVPAEAVAAAMLEESGAVRAARAE
jgi:anti-sigma28 factor (negative regulator of flagellin synthesis)